jgi:hypothetical protein
LTYNGSPQGGTVKVTGLNGIILTPTPQITYAGVSPTIYGPSVTAPTNAGSYSASATFTGNNNYNSSSAQVTFYINPGGKTAKKIRTYLRCVSEKVAGEYYGYTAIFGYINDNAVPVYIPIGTDNRIDPLSAVNPATKQPELFLPGSYEFPIKFTGANITWTVTSYDSDHKTSTTSGATLSSPKCSSTKSAEVTTNADITETQPRELQAYPNPTNDRVTINFMENPDVSEIIVMDIMGRTLQVEKRWVPSVGLEINFSGVVSGVYLVKVNNGGTPKTFRIIKE